MCPQAFPDAAPQVIAALPALLRANDYQQQADAVISQADPVSDTVYNVLPASDNVEINSIGVAVTWAVTQPTNLRVIVTVDGIAKTFTIAAPVSATAYAPSAAIGVDEASQLLASATGELTRQALQGCKGRNVQVDVAVTWATTQPTPLDCRVKWAQRT